MPKLSKEFKESISALSEKEKDRIIFKLARGSQPVFQMLRFEYLEETSKEELFQSTQSQLSELFSTINATKNVQKQLVNRIKKYIRLCNEFKKTTSNLALFIDLHVGLLKYILDNYGTLLNSKTTVLDNKLAITTQKTLNLISKIHADYWMDYKVDMDYILSELKHKGAKLPRIEQLPFQFEWT